MKQKYKIFLLVALVLFSISPIAHAALVNCGGPGQAECGLRDLIFTVERIVNFLLSWAWLISILFILYAAQQMILSGGNQENLSKGKETLKNALLGFFLIMIAFVLINFVINIVTGQGNSGSSYNIFRDLLPKP
jgi:hypothetical protein